MIPRISLPCLLASWCLVTPAIAAKPVGDPGGRAPAVSRSSPATAAFVVVIDAGHGGKDGGAQGPNGTLEKDVVLAIAKQLAALIRQEPGMRGVMVRSGDQFVDLRRRAEIARKAQADLFISLHADAYEDSDAAGLSVFTLSETGASSAAARCLADRENAGEIGGVDLKAQEAMLASVLVDLSKNATIEASDQAANRVMAALQKEFPVHNPAIQKAGFAVLKSLDVPSMLIETTFISNPGEESKLLDPRHQERIARAILRGIRAYRSETSRITKISVKPPGP
jgi:N-acetylmuramoyl-L-alanine amidase